MRRKLVVGGLAAGSIAVGGVAWAMLSATINTPDLAIGFGTASGSSGCQTSAVTFTVPDPTWDSSGQEFVVSTIDYSGIAAGCVSLGTADLTLYITSGGNEYTGTSSNMGASSGTLTMTPTVPFDAATSGQYDYIVKDS